MAGKDDTPKKTARRRPAQSAAAPADGSVPHPVSTLSPKERAALKPEDNTDQAQVTGQITSERVDHALAHVARIQITLDRWAQEEASGQDVPDHREASRDNLERLLANYQSWLAGVAPEVLQFSRARIEGRVPGVDAVPGLTADHIGRAVRHLGG